MALPSSTFDWQIKDGVKEIPIEERDPDEVRYVQGLHNGSVCSVLIPPQSSPAVNFAFDVTPARLVTGFITERGICRGQRRRYSTAVSGKVLIFRHPSFTGLRFFSIYGVLSSLNPDTEIKN